MDQFEVRSAARKAAIDRSGLSADYQKLLDANPYANLTAKGGFLGIGRKKEQQQLDMKAAEYDANILMQQYSEDYNSPEAQVQRMRDAGINPDLAGGVSAGESAAVPVSPSEMKWSDPAQQIAMTADVLLNIASLAMAMPEALASTAASKLASGLALGEAGASLAKAFPEETIDIAPKGLAPVLIKSGVSAQAIADAIPNLGKRQRQSLAKSIAMHRQSLVSTVSSASSRKQLAEILNSPSMQMPEVARDILGLQSLLSLEELKGNLRLKKALAENDEKRAKKAAENADKAVEVESQRLDASAAQAAAEKASAGAEIAESKVRGDIARSTDGKAIGEARTEDAIRDKIAAETAEAQLDVIESAEDEGLFDGTFITDILGMKVLSGHDSENWREVKDKWKKRRAAKREEKRFYKQRSSSGSISIGPKGVSYSE